MFAKFYRTPTIGSTYSDDFLFATNKVGSYDYTERWTSPGDFTLTLPLDDVIRKNIKSLQINNIILIDDDWLWMQDIQYGSSGKITISGQDCKGFLTLRESTFGETRIAGTEGYDVVKGTTAECVKHYLNNNIINPADPERKMPVTWNAYSGINGLANDSYMARLENLSDIVKTLCDNAGIGYRMKGKLGTGGFVFELARGTDRSITQVANPRVIFSIAWKNVVSMEFEHSVSNLYNAIYATGADVTKTVYRDAQNIPTGISRRETAIDVSVEESADIEKYALAAVEDNLETHTYKITPANDQYGSKYFLGDIVTVKDDITGNYYNEVITEVTKSCAAGQKSITITLGKQKPKLLNQIINNMISGVQKRR